MTIKPNSYKILSDCIDRGLSYGYNHAHKHIDTPSEEAILEEQHDAIMNEICDYFNFSDTVNEGEPL
jgi:hypothetical protein